MVVVYCLVQCVIAFDKVNEVCCMYSDYKFLNYLVLVLSRVRNLVG